MILTLARWFRNTDPARSKEKVAHRVPQPVNDPTLCRVMRLIVQHVAPLAEHTKIAQAVIGRVAVQMRRSKFDARGAQPRHLHQVRPAHRTAAPVAPRGR